MKKSFTLFAKNYNSIFTKTLLTSCVVFNLSGNVNAQCSPDVTAPIISCPSNISVNNDPGLCDATIIFGDPVTTDNCTVLQSTTFSFTGSLQTFTVPAGVTSITIETWGAQGQGGNGGLGGYVKGDLTVTPGQVLNIMVGGQNGYNGGGIGYAAIPKNGGGATDVRVGGVTINDRVIVAGGGGSGGPTDVGNHQGGHGGGGTAGVNYAGGGGGAGYGGAGSIGGLNGGTGNTSCHSGGAGGAGFNNGGMGSCNTCYTASCGQNGTLGQGGNGSTWENGICFSTYGGTAGGGGGYYGGGGTSVGNCGSGAGGGGSSWSGTLANNVLTGGIRLGNGEVVITYMSQLVVVTQLAGFPSGNSFPVGTTTQTFEAEDASGNTATCSFNISVIDTEAPIADQLSLSDFSACNSATPTAPTASDICAGTLNGIPDVTFPISNAGTTTVTWTYDDGNGNTTSQTQDVIVTIVDVSTTVTLATTITANNGTATSYQWINCNTGNSQITGATAQSFVAPSDGSYAVIVTESGCSDTSTCVIINTATINQNQLAGVKIYPSPSNGIYVIELDQVYERVYVTITDVSGKQIDAYSSYNSSKINGEFVGATGIYFLRIEADGKTIVSPLVIE